MDKGSKARIWVGKDGLRYTDRYGGVTQIEGMKIVSRLWAKQVAEEFAKSDLMRAPKARG